MLARGAAGRIQTGDELLHSLGIQYFSRLFGDRRGMILQRWSSAGRLVLFYWRYWVLEGIFSRRCTCFQDLTGYCRYRC
jgi:hypothetical protein